MNAKPEVPPSENRPGLAAGILTRFGQVGIVFIFQAAILFLASGKLSWTWAWVFLGLYLASVLVMGAFLLRANPETIAERAGLLKETKDWDKTIGGAWGLIHFVLLPLITGLDVRYGWAPELGKAWHMSGAIAFVVGLGLFGWAMISNAYFSTAVRIQDDRGQTVCRTGPYQFVRHPGYIGAVFQSLGIPFLLGSLWALAAGITAAILMIIQTSLEDRMLQAELPGYREFAQEVRYRLVPGVW